MSCRGDHTPVNTNSLIAPRFAFYSLPQSACLYASGMLKQRRENRLINCLVCWICRGRMGPNHFTLKDGGAVCSLCGTKNPLGNLRKMSIQEVTEPSAILCVLCGPEPRRMQSTSTVGQSWVRGLTSLQRRRWIGHSFTSARRTGR
jgi:hypothetical protein